MNAISSRWHKPKSRLSKKKLASIAKAQKRWSAVKNNDEIDDESVSKIENSATPSMNCTIISSGKEKICASKRKLSEHFGSLPSSSPNHEEKTDGNPSYIFMNTDMWSSLLKNVKCDVCMSFSLDVTSETKFGFSTKIKLICKNCLKVFSSIFSSPRDEETNCFEANKKLVEAFLKIGKGHAALEIFSMTIGVNAMDKKTFSKCMLSLYEEKKNFKEDILQITRNIVRKKYQEISAILDEDIFDITVSYDGTWQKRGHSSLYGLGFVVDILTGLILDYEIMSKYCPECTIAKRDLGKTSVEYHIWYEGHQPQCSQNHFGSSSSMEMKAAEFLWERSIEVARMRYTGILCDGDAKTFQHLLSLKVYGAGSDIVKEECVNHVAKRLGTGLRNKVKDLRSKGVTIGGRKEGSLKEDTIVKLTNFYRKAITDNAPNIDEMKSAIYATLLHCSSTDKQPKHNKCPMGATSWCFFQRALAEKRKPPSHSCMKTKLTEDVVSKILPVYQRLASTELLARCVSGKTQNVNESVHSLVWKNCPKEVFVSKKRLEMAVISSISEYNFGCLNSLEIEKNTNPLSLSIAERRDKRRIYHSQLRSSSTFKNEQKAKKFCKTRKNNASVKKEGKTYGAGAF